MKIQDFLSIPASALPNALYLDDDNSWQDDAWESLREAARTGQTCEMVCGSKVRVQADHPAWIGGVIFD